MELDEKKLERILTKQREEYQGFATEERRDFQRHVGAMFEEVQHRISAVAEMVAQNTEDITVIKTDIVDMKADIADIKIELKTKADKSVVSTLDHRLGALEASR